MYRQYLVSFLILVGLFASAAAFASDPHSVADYFHETGRDASFDGRAAEYCQLFPNEEYLGTAEQNQRLLGITRVADVLASGGERSTAAIPQSQPIATQLDFADEFDEWVPDRCRTIFPPTEDPRTWAIDSLAQRGGTCCGPNARCDHLGSDCLPFLRPQNQICADHDRRLRECGAPWWDLTSPCVVDAHRKLANSSTNPLLAAPFHAFSQIGTPLPPEDDPSEEEAAARRSLSFPSTGGTTDFGITSEMLSQPASSLARPTAFPDSTANHTSPNLIPWASGLTVP